MANFQVQESEINKSLRRGLTSLSKTREVGAERLSRARASHLQGLQFEKQFQLSNEKFKAEKEAANATAGQRTLELQEKERQFNVNVRMKFYEEGLEKAMELYKRDNNPRMLNDIWNAMATDPELKGANLPANPTWITTNKRQDVQMVVYAKKGQPLGPDGAIAQHDGAFASNYDPKTNRTSWTLATEAQLKAANAGPSQQAIDHANQSMDFYSKGNRLAQTDKDERQSIVNAMIRGDAAQGSPGGFVKWFESTGIPLQKDILGDARELRKNVATENRRDNYKRGAEDRSETRKLREEDRKLKSDIRAEQRKEDKKMARDERIDIKRKEKEDRDFNRQIAKEDRDLLRQLDKEDRDRANRVVTVREELLREMVDTPFEELEPNKQAVARAIFPGLTPITMSLVVNALNRSEKFQNALFEDDQVQVHAIMQETIRTLTKGQQDLQSAQQGAGGTLGDIGAFNHDLAEE